MQNLTWKTVKEYQLGWTGTGEKAIVFLKFEDGTEMDLPVHTISDLYYLGKLLKNSINLEYSPDTKDFRPAWQQAGGVTT